MKRNQQKPTSNLRLNTHHKDTKITAAAHFRLGREAKERLIGVSN